MENLVEKPSAPAKFWAEAKENPAWADRLGLCLSGLCLIHCLMTPVLFLILPSLNLGVFHKEFHVVLLTILPLVALVAFVPGYRRHRHWSVFAWALPGLVLITFAALNTVPFLGEFTETLVSVLGSLFLIQAHLLNRRLCACCATHRH